MPSSPRSRRPPTIQSWIQKELRPDCCGSRWTAPGRSAWPTRTLSRSRPDAERGTIALIATDAALLDPAEAIGRKADDLLARAQAAGEQLVPAQRAIPQLQSAWVRAANTVSVNAKALPVPGSDRLLRLAAALSETAALSGARDLHPRDLAPAVALTAAIQGAAGLQRLTPKEIQDRPADLERAGPGSARTNHAAPSRLLPTFSA